MKSFRSIKNISTCLIIALTMLNACSRPAAEAEEILETVTEQSLTEEANNLTDAPAVQPPIVINLINPPELSAWAGCWTSLDHYLDEIERSRYEEPVNWYIFQAESETEYPYFVFRGKNEQKTETILPHFESLGC